MRGQYRVVREIILFAIGVAITSFVIVSFNNVETRARELAVTDNLAEVSSMLISGIVEVAQSNRSSFIVLEIPEKISGQIYRITVNNDDLKLALFNNPQINVTQKLFNMTKSYFITGDVISTARHVTIESSPPNIIIRRAVV